MLRLFRIIQECKGFLYFLCKSFTENNKSNKLIYKMHENFQSNWAYSNVKIQNTLYFYQNNEKLKYNMEINNKTLKPSKKWK